MALPSSPLPSPVCFDILDFHKLDWFTASKHLGTLLAQKGFCFIKGSLKQEEKDLINKEVEDLKATNRLVQTPLEAVDALFGEATSAWTYEVATALVDPEAKLPEDEKGLRVVDAFLDNVGYCVSASSTRYLHRAVRGRVPGILHQCRLPEDPEPPELQDPDEACRHASHCSSRKVVLLYYLGPSKAVASLCPRGDASKIYEVRIEEDTVLVYLNDACELYLQELGPGRIFEVNLMLQTKQSQQQAPKDVLSIPPALHQWFEARLRELRSGASQADGDVSFCDEVPFSYIKQAALSYLQGEPVKVVAQRCELPSLPRGDHIATPLEGCLLGGLDTAAPIKAPPPKGTNARDLKDLQFFGAKWDLSEYYSEDGDVDNLKLYTKHLNVLYTSYDIALEFDYSSFGITQEENASLDHRCRMLCEAHRQVLSQQPEVAKQSRSLCWGIYSGLTGQQQDVDVRINKHSWANTSNAALVNRCAYGLKFNGPCLAIDTGDSSGLVASDTAVRALREGVCDAALASSATWIENPFGELLLLCAAGFISRSGRTKVFDASSDGYTKGEGVVAILLQPGRDLENKELREVTGAKALLGGTGINTRGQSSALGSPSGPAVKDVVSKAMRDARFPAFVVDAVEASASGEVLADQVELKVMNAFLHHQDDKAQAIAISSSKASFGQLGAPSGLVGLARFIVLLERGVHGPQIHLHELVDAQLDEEARSRILFLTEATEARGYAQIYGVSSFGRSGSNCHQVLLGQKPTPPEQPQFRSIQWWPGSKQSEQAWHVLRGYFLVGTMTAWTEGLRMEEESEGVYGYTLTMGDNNWEKFQIWIDEDPDKVLHPQYSDEGSESIIQGPAGDVPQALCWKISGTREEVRFVNEVQFEALEKSGLQIKSTQENLKGLEVVLKEKDHEIANHENAIANLNFKIGTLDDEIVKLNDHCDRMQMEKEAHKEHIGKLNEKIEHANIENQKLQTILAEMEEKKQVLQTGCDDQSLRLSDLQQQYEFKCNEIEVLKDCFKQIKLQDGEEEPDEEEMTERLQNLLKVHEVTEKNDKLQEKVEELEAEAEKLRRTNKMFEEDNVEKTERAELAESKATQALLIQREKEIELEALQKYFKSSEVELHRKITAEESTRISIENQLHSEQAKASSAVVDADKYRQLYLDIKKQIEEIDESKKEQLSNIEKKAHQNWLDYRAAVREVDGLKDENEILRRKLYDLEVRGSRPNSSASKVDGRDSPATMSPMPGVPSHGSPVPFGAPPMMGPLPPPSSMFPGQRRPHPADFLGMTPPRQPFPPPGPATKGHATPPPTTVASSAQSSQKPIDSVDSFGHDNTDGSSHPPLPLGPMAGFGPPPSIPPMMRMPRFPPPPMMHPSPNGPLPPPMFLPRPGGPMPPPPQGTRPQASSTPNRS